MSWYNDKLSYFEFTSHIFKLNSSKPIIDFKFIYTCTYMPAGHKFPSDTNFQCLKNTQTKPFNTKNCIPFRLPDIGLKVWHVRILELSETFRCKLTTLCHIVFMNQFTIENSYGNMATQFTNEEFADMHLTMAYANVRKAARLRWPRVFPKRISNLT